MSKVVISDTSCLIAFDHIGKTEILEKLFGILLITDWVAQEYGKPIPAFIQVHSNGNNKIFKSLSEKLDKGEASAIALAFENPGSVLIIDERKGRKIAGELGIDTIGTLRILLEAKRKNHISSVRDVLVKLENHKFRFSKSIAHEILKLANEL